MKRLLILLIFLSISFSGGAVHIVGGSITWECQSDGKYIFYLEVYRDCRGVEYQYHDEIIDIVGSPLPVDVSNNVINNIVVSPDSAKWNLKNQGRLIVPCDTAAGLPVTCGWNNNTQRTIQVFYYKSSPLLLIGSTPSSGWEFYWQSICCRPRDLINTLNGQVLLLKSIMFKVGINNGICFDSSPTFVQDPHVLIPRGAQVNNITFVANDSDGDSLVYEFSSAIEPPRSSPRPVLFANGYSQNSPLPDRGFNVSNFTNLDRKTGMLAAQIFNGVGELKYLLVVQIKSFKDGALASIVSKELPFSILDFPLLSDSSQNLPPDYIFNRKDTNLIDVTVAVGQHVEIPISITDTNLSSAQLLTMTMNGSHFSQDFTSTGTCQNFSNSNCAYLDNSILLRDTVLGVPSYKIEAVGQINTTFKWQTDCSLLGANGQDKTYYFYFDVHDNFCPVPASRAAVIAVTVTNSETTILPKLECVKSSILGTDVYWNQSVYNSINNFQSLEIYKASSRNGSYTRLTTITDTTTFGFQDLVATNGGNFYYLKVNGTSCSNQPQSIYSDTLTDPDNKLTVINNPSCFKLSWNAQDRSYQTKYLIFREYPLGSGFTLIDSTYNTSGYCDPFDICNDSVKYYVRKESGGNCSFDLTEGLTAGNSVLMNNGIQEINHVLTANVSYGRFQWYDCNKQSIILGETNQTFTPQDTGNYAVILYQYGCVDSSNCILYFPVGLPENTFQSQLNYYPNPTNGLVQIDFKQVQQNVVVEVYSIQGKLVQNQRIQNSESIKIELNQPSGIYFIQLINGKGERANLKIVKS